MKIPNDPELKEFYAPELKAIRQSKLLLLFLALGILAIITLIIVGVIPYYNLIIAIGFGYLIHKQRLNLIFHNSTLCLMRYLMEPEFNKQFSEKHGLNKGSNAEE